MLARRHWAPLRRSAARYAGALAAVWHVASAVTSGAAHPVDTLEILDSPEVHAVLQTSEGSVYVGGWFRDQGTSLVKLRADGTLDPNWNARGDGVVTALAADGEYVYVAGVFTSIGGLNRSGLARILKDGDGSADATWAPGGVDHLVSSLALDGDSLFIGGCFTSVDGVSRTNLAKMSRSTGAVDPIWCPFGADRDVETLLIHGDYLYAGGAFSNLNGRASPGLGRLGRSDGGRVDSTWNPRLDGLVKALAAEPGNVYVAGSFTRINETDRVGLAKLDDRTATLDLSWAPDGVQGGVMALVATNHAVYVAGTFTNAAGADVRGLTRLIGPTGVRDDSWLPGGAWPSVRSVQFVPPEHLLAGGLLSVADGEPALGLVRLRTTSSGQPDASFRPRLGHVGTIRALCGDAEGRVYVGGDFEWVNGLFRPNLFRLGPDGNLDLHWTTLGVSESDSNGGLVETMAVGTNALFVAGQFSAAGGLPRRGGAKIGLDRLGKVDEIWRPGWPPGSVKALAVSDRAVFVGGRFDSVRGEDLRNLAKVDIATAAPDMSWCAVGAEWGGDGEVRDLTLHRDHLVVAGRFHALNGHPVSHLARIKLHGAGAVDPDWLPSVSEVAAVAMISNRVFVALDAGGVFAVRWEEPAELQPVTGIEHADALVATDDGLWWSRGTHVGRRGWDGAPWLASFGATTSARARALWPRPGEVLVVGTGLTNRVTGRATALMRWPISEAPLVGHLTTLEDTLSTGRVMVARSPRNGSEVSHVCVASIEGGTLWSRTSASGPRKQVAPGTVLDWAEVGAGWHFMPDPHETNAGCVTFEPRIGPGRDPAVLIPLLATCRIDVVAVNDPPTLAPIASRTVQEGDLVAVAIDATDPDGTPASLEVEHAPAEVALDSRGRWLVWQTRESDGPATHRIGLCIPDQGDPARPVRADLGIGVFEVNAAPRIFGKPPLLATAGVAWAFQPEADDGDWPPQMLWFGRASGPSWLQVDPLTGFASGRPGTNDAGRATFTIWLSDGLLTNTLRWETTVLVHEPDRQTIALRPFPPRPDAVRVVRSAPLRTPTTVVLQRTDSGGRAQRMVAVIPPGAAEVLLPVGGGAVRIEDVGSYRVGLPSWTGLRSGRGSRMPAPLFIRGWRKTGRLFSHEGAGYVLLPQNSPGRIHRLIESQRKQGHPTARQNSDAPPMAASNNIAPPADRDRASEIADEPNWDSAAAEPAPGGAWAVPDRAGSRRPRAEPR